MSFLAATFVLRLRNYRRIEERNERRRMRIVMVGFGILVFAAVLLVVLIMPLGPIQRFHAYWMESYFECAMPLLFAFRTGGGCQNIGFRPRKTDGRRYGNGEHTKHNAGLTHRYASLYVA